MTSRERVLAAIAHKEADRVPIDQGSNHSSGIMAIAYNQLKCSMGVTDGMTYVYDLVQQLAQPEDWYLDRFHVDAIDMGRAFAPAGGMHPWVLPDGSHSMIPGWFLPSQEDGAYVYRDADGDLIARMPEASLYYDQACWPLGAPGGLDDFEPLARHMGKVLWAAIPSPPFDEPLTPERLAEIARAAHELHRSSDRAVVLPVGCNLIEWSQFLFGAENAYVYMAGEKRKFAAFLDRLTELHLEKLHTLLPPLRGAVDLLIFGDDLGTQRGPQISPAMYREVFLPRHKRIYETAKRLSGAAIGMHSCGGIFPLIPSLIEAGVEVLNPVQTSARGMEPEVLKREYGRDITFWGGGCDTRDVLPNATPEQVRAHVRGRLEIFMPGGGFVFNQVHNIMAGVPPANIEAMLDAAFEFGAYGG